MPDKKNRRIQILRRHHEETLPREHREHETNNKHASSKPAAILKNNPSE